MLVSDGMLGRAEADAFLVGKPSLRHDSHPLVTLGGQNWKSQPPHKPLTREVLTEWLGGKAWLEYVHRDPLKKACDHCAFPAP